MSKYSSPRSYDLKLKNLDNKCKRKRATKVEAEEYIQVPKKLNHIYSYT